MGHHSHLVHILVDIVADLHIGHSMDLSSMGGCIDIRQLGFGVDVGSDLVQLEVAVVELE